MFLKQQSSFAFTGCGSTVDILCALGLSPPLSKFSNLVLANLYYFNHHGTQQVSHGNPILMLVVRSVPREVARGQVQVEDDYMIVEILL